MVSVSGPTSSMPGSHHNLPAGTKCDAHPNTFAIVRVQGETDSFGAEYNDMCQECHNEYKEEIKKETGRCDYCKTDEVKTYPHRDYEEGLYGPVYQVCNKCISKEQERINRELDEWDNGVERW